jgi:hypothetical protein
VAVAFVASAAMMFAVAACQAGPPNLVLQLNVAPEHETLTVSGDTDLPDKTIVGVSGSAWEGNALDERMARADATVENGHYSVTLDVPGWKSGDHVGVIVAFYPSYPGQPQSVIARFGATGDNLRGPGVRFNDNDGSHY